MDAGPCLVNILPGALSGGTGSAWEGRVGVGVEAGLSSCCDLRGLELGLCG